ncbi:pol, partial [Symbiodinium necroappetens]
MPTQWSEARGFRCGSNATVQCDLEVLLRVGVPLFSGADGVLLADTVPADAIFRILAADDKRGNYTEVLAEIGPDRRLHLVRDLRAEAVEATAAAMDTSAAAAGSADVGGPEAPSAGVQLGGLPDTTAPAAAAAHPERSAADVDMGDEMTEAAVEDPDLTVGQLVDKTTDKLKFMEGYMEGAARMVQFEAALSCRAGAEHSRVLTHAEQLLHKGEEYLEQRDAEAGAAASGAPSSGSAAPDQDAEDRDDPMEGPPAAEPAAGSAASSEELVADEPARSLRTASQVPRRFKAVAHVAPPGVTLAAPLGDAQVAPDAEPDGSFLCPECGKGLDTVVRWHLHRAACHDVRLPAAVFPEPTSSDQIRQDYREIWFRLSKKGHFFEMNELNRSRTAKRFGDD